MDIIRWAKRILIAKNRFNAALHKPDCIVWGETRNGNKGMVMYIDNEGKWVHAWQDASARPYLYIDVIWWAYKLKDL